MAARVAARRHIAQLLSIGAACLEDRMLGLLLGLPPGASAPRVESTSQLRGYAGSWEPKSSRVFVELQIMPGLQPAT